MFSFIIWYDTFMIHCSGLYIFYYQFILYLVILITGFKYIFHLSNKLNYNLVIQNDCILYKFYYILKFAKK